jgi:hypothetical protein
MNSSELALIVILICGVVLLALVAIVGGFVHSRRERLLTHQERMKALELGRDLPDNAATARVKAVFGAGSTDEGDARSLARKCFSTALWVGFWGFLFASQTSWANMGIAIVIACSAGAVGVTAMICGTILALRGSSDVDHRLATKPAFESDAFDVVSRRG